MAPFIVYKMTVLFDSGLQMLYPPKYVTAMCDSDVTKGEEWRVIEQMSRKVWSSATRLNLVFVVIPSRNGGVYKHFPLVRYPSCTQASFRPYPSNLSQTKYRNYTGDAF